MPEPPRESVVARRAPFVLAVTDTAGNPVTSVVLEADMVDQRLPGRWVQVGRTVIEHIEEALDAR